MNGELIMIGKTEFDMISFIYYVIPCNDWLAYDLEINPQHAGRSDESMYVLRSSEKGRNSNEYDQEQTLEEGII